MISLFYSSKQCFCEQSCIYTFSHSLLFPRISFYKRNLGSKVYLFFSLSTNCSVAFRKDLPVFVAQKPSGRSSHGLCPRPLYPKPLAQCQASTSCCVSDCSTELTSVNFSFLICEVGKSFSPNEPHSLCLANGVEIHYFPVAVWVLKETMHVKGEGVEKWFRV